jgi:hypothetical protein
MSDARPAVTIVVVRKGNLFRQYFRLEVRFMGIMLFKGTTKYDDFIDAENAVRDFKAANNSSWSNGGSNPSVAK